MTSIFKRFRLLAVFYYFGRTTLASRFAWLIVLVMSCCVFARAQSEGVKDQSSVTVPPSMMNRELTTIKDRRLRLSDYSDKIIILNLFAHWCGPCVINLRDLIQLSKKYKTHRIEVLGLVSHKNDPLIATVRKFARQQKIKFQVIWDDDDFEESLVKLVNGRSVMPQTFIIDRAGRVRKHFQGYSPLNTPQLLREALDQVGKETEPNKPRISP